MFQRLLDLWRSRDFPDEAFEQALQMLEDCRWMFETVSDALTGRTEVKNISEEIYTRDKEVNRAERDIRSRILTHLAVHPETDVPTCLVLMSIVKDIERIGDYCKNIFEVAILYKQRLGEEGRYMAPLHDIRTTICQLFTDTAGAIRDSDLDLAGRVVETGRSVARRCDELIESLIRDDLPTSKTVAYTLLSRHYKRVGAHLVNIATSVINPLDQLDFKARPKQSPESPS